MLVTGYPLMDRAITAKPGRIGKSSLFMLFRTPPGHRSFP